MYFIPSKNKNTEVQQDKRFLILKTMQILDNKWEKAGVGAPYDRFDFITTTMSSYPISEIAASILYCILRICIVKEEEIMSHYPVNQDKITFEIDRLSLEMKTLTIPFIFMIINGTVGILAIVAHCVSFAIARFPSITPKDFNDIIKVALIPYLVIRTDDRICDGNFIFHIALYILQVLGREKLIRIFNCKGKTGNELLDFMLKTFYDGGDGYEYDIQKIFETIGEDRIDYFANDHERWYYLHASSDLLHARTFTDNMLKSLNASGSGSRTEEHPVISDLSNDVYSDLIRSLNYHLMELLEMTEALETPGKKIEDELELINNQLNEAETELNKQHDDELQEMQDEGFKTELINGVKQRHVKELESLRANFAKKKDRLERVLKARKEDIPLFSIQFESQKEEKPARGSKRLMSWQHKDKKAKKLAFDQLTKRKKRTKAASDYIETFSKDMREIERKSYDKELLKRKRSQIGESSNESPSLLDYSVNDHSSQIKSKNIKLIDELSRNIQDRNEEIQDLTHRLREAEQQLMKYDNERKSIAEQKEKIKKESDALDLVRKDLDDKQVELEKRSTEIEKIKANLAELQRDFANRKTIMHTPEEVMELRNKIKKLKDDLHHKQVELDQEALNAKRARVTIEEYTTINKSQYEELTRNKATLNDQLKEIEDLREKIDKQKSRISFLKEQKRKLETQANTSTAEVNTQTDQPLIKLGDSSHEYSDTKADAKSDDSEESRSHHSDDAAATPVVKQDYEEEDNAGEELKPIESNGLDDDSEESRSHHSDDAAATPVVKQDYEEEDNADNDVAFLMTLRPNDPRRLALYEEYPLVDGSNRRAPISGGSRATVNNIINLVSQIAMRPEIRARYINKDFIIKHPASEKKVVIQFQSGDRIRGRQKKKLYGLQFWFNPSLASSENTTELSDSLFTTALLSQANYFILDSQSPQVITEQILGSFDGVSVKLCRNLSKAYHPSKIEYFPLEKSPYMLTNNSVKNYVFKSSVKPRHINIKTSMFKLLPFSSLILQNFYSPQKDIFNVTRIARENENNENILQAPYINIMPYESEDKLCIDYNIMLKTTTELGSSRYAEADHKIHVRALTLSNSKSSDIYKFIERLITTNIETLFTEGNSVKFNNLGFDVGSDLNQNRIIGASRRITGGANDVNIIHDTFCSRFVNINNIVPTSNALELLSSAYNIDGSSSEDSFSDGKLLYASLFKSDFGQSTSMLSYRHMFTLIMNYFHKFNVSFSSMFDQLCFPSILFNASALRLFTDRMSSLASNNIITVMNESVKTTDDNQSISYKKKLFSVITTYLRGFAKQGNVLDNSLDYRYQLKYMNRNSIVPIDKAMELVQAKEGERPDFEKNLTLWLSNQYASISVANSFFYELIRYVDIEGNTTERDNDTNYSKIRSTITALFPSNALSSLRHLDAITTYVNVIFMLLKQTTYYDHENDADVSFFNNTEVEPFSVT